MSLTKLALNRIHAHHFSRNPASGRVLEKIGMRHEGCLRQHIRRWGRFEDIECYGIVNGARLCPQDQPQQALKTNSLPRAPTAIDQKSGPGHKG